MDLLGDNIQVSDDSTYTNTQAWKKSKKQLQIEVEGNCKWNDNPLI